MGGLPRDALVTVALPPTLELSWAQGFYKGLARAARAFGVNVVGGETAASPSGIFASVALTGALPDGRYVTRRGGRPGDALFVTGRLGGSLKGRHLRFRPRLAEGRWLTRRLPPHAMMDLSDGLAKDAPRLARASGTGLEIDEASVPRNPGCTAAEALGDGEDYELLFAVSPDDAGRLPADWAKAFPRLPLTCVGRLTSPASEPKAGRGGYDHFGGESRPAAKA